VVKICAAKGVTLTDVPTALPSTGSGGSPTTTTTTTTTTTGEAQNTGAAVVNRVGLGIGGVVGGVMAAAVVVVGF
jgi:hypothetical protein